MLFHAGQRVQESGRYWVRHYQHRLPLLVEFNEGQTFPHCKRCGDRVTFERADGKDRPIAEDRDLAA